MLLMISPTYYPSIGGTEEAIKSIFSRFNEEVHLVTPNFNPIMSDEREECGSLKVYRANIKKQYTKKWQKFIYYQWAVYKKIKQLMKVYKYRAVVIHYAFPNYFVQQYLRRKGLPIYIVEHHFGTGIDITSASENPKMVNRFIKNAYVQAKKVIVGSKTQRDFVNTFVDNNKIKIIPFGTDISKFRLNTKKNKVVYVGRLVERKHPDEVIEIAKLCPEVEFVIIGDGPLKETLEETNNVKVLGIVSQEEVAEHLSTARYFLLPSRYEGFGIVYIEAMASGCFLLSYPNNAITEILDLIPNHSLVGKKYKNINEAATIIKSLNYPDPVFINLCSHIFDIKHTVAKYEKVINNGKV